jgi:hypothetical protein
MSIKISSRDNDEMESHFKNRTNFHVSLVQKYLDIIKNLNLSGVDNNILEEEKDHDSGKFEEPEYTPYLHITWKYKMKDQGENYTPDADMKKKMDEATFHHISTHKHHPDYWDKELTPEAINTVNRDKPGKVVDASDMPLSYVASMMADWAAMSEEKGESLKKWIDSNVNTRWKFTPAQVNLINKLEPLLSSHKNVKAAIPREILQPRIDERKLQIIQEMQDNGENTCDRCGEAEDSNDLIWITAEDFEPRDGEELPDNAYTKYDALCEDCYNGMLKGQI